MVQDNLIPAGEEEAGIPWQTVDQWVNYIQSLYRREIDLSLDRVHEVYARLSPAGVPFKVVSIAGTNGKGSTAELLASICCAAGYRVGKYTSPHLQRFNERYQLNRVDIDDQSLLESFSRVEHARADTGLTFFEFGTLVAIDLFVSAGVDIAIMEVGLGGRLDAVNILDSDVSVITSIAIDHTRWLGETVEQIGYEKAGIVRPGRPCIAGMKKPPESVTTHCRQHGAVLSVLGRDFSFTHSTADDYWSWSNAQHQFTRLPLPFGQAGLQLYNAAAAIQAAMLLPWCEVTADAVHQGLSDARLRGRCEVVSESPRIILDVAHNAASVARLHAYLEQEPVPGKLFALCGMLKDKQIAESLSPLLPMVDSWHLATIQGERGTASDHLSAILRAAAQQQNLEPAPQIQVYHDAVTAFEAVAGNLESIDCLIVFGSFLVVGDIIPLLQPGRVIE